MVENKLHRQHDYEWQAILDEDDRFDYHSQFDRIGSEIEEEIVYNSPYSERCTEVFNELGRNHTS